LEEERLSEVRYVGCPTCTFTPNEVRECGIRKYQYAVYLKKCPREEQK
jgi:hypothetical protein